MHVLFHKTILATKQLHQLPTCVHPLDINEGTSQESSATVADDAATVTSGAHMNDWHASQFKLNVVYTKAWQNYSFFKRDRHTK